MEGGRCTVLDVGGAEGPVRDMTWTEEPGGLLSIELQRVRHD